MKTLFKIAAVLILTLAAAPSWSQVTGNTTSSATTQSQAGSSSIGGTQGITFNSDGGGKTTLRTAPALGGQSFYGSFSPDSCVTAAGGGGSVTGFAVNLAVPVRDTFCPFMRAFERTMQAAMSEDDPVIRKKLKQAGRDIMCQAEEFVRRAYAGQGLCSPEFSDGKDEHQVSTSDRHAREERMNDVYSPG